jgi:VanZ family protein
MRRGSWVPPVLWMAVILWLASDTGSAERTGRLLVPILTFLFPGASPIQIEVMHGAIRKLGHVIEYAILAGLWLRAFTRDGVSRRPAAWRAWAIAAAWAAIDESYQAMVSTRTGSAVDVALDAAGALAVAMPGALGWRPVADSLTRVVLWIAAVGGAALLALNLAVDVASGVLWVTVPAAVLALIVLRRRRAAAPPAPDACD